MQRKDSCRATFQCIRKPGKTRHESQSPLSLQTEKYDRTERPVVYAHLSSYSERNIDKNWSSQEWRSDELMDDRTGRPLVAHSKRTDSLLKTMRRISHTEAESELSLGSRSFLHRVNDRLRKMLNRSPEDSMQDSDKHSVIWGLFMSSTLQASVFMGKNYSAIGIPQKHRRSHNETDVRHI